MTQEPAPKPRRTRRPTAASAAAGTPTAEAAQPLFTPTAEAKAMATRKRVIALVLWGVAIALELVAIFWLLRPPFDELVATKGFPQWRWYLLLAFLAAIGALSIIGSQLWKRANRLDPAARRETVRFFVQNQLGAIIALVAFLPLIIVIFLDKDMNSQQKGIAGGVGVAVALAAVLLGVDFKPLSSEQAAVESQVVTQLAGRDWVFWTPGGSVVHLCSEVADLTNSAQVDEGPIANAFTAGKEGITLKLDQELAQCGLTPPANLPEIVEWVKTARGVA